MAHDSKIVVAQVASGGFLKPPRSLSYTLLLPNPSQNILSPNTFPLVGSSSVLTAALLPHLGVEGHSSVPVFGLPNFLANILTLGLLLSAASFLLSLLLFTAHLRPHSAIQFLKMSLTRSFSILRLVEMSDGAIREWRHSLGRTPFVTRNSADGRWRRERLSLI
jgi:hypothetical protein